MSDNYNMAQQILQFQKPMLSSTLDEHNEENDTFDSEIREDIIINEAGESQCSDS